MDRLLVLLLLLPFPAHAILARAKAKTEARFLSQCEKGSGKSCYDYGRLQWGKKGSRNKATAKKYFLRGCDLKYKLSCETYKDHSFKVVHSRKLDAHAQRTRPVCFVPSEMNNATFSPNAAPPPEQILGQRVTKIKPDSFWDRADLKEGDVIMRVNNMPFNSLEEMLSSLGSSGKSFAFVVRRADQTITLWYTCQ